MSSFNENTKINFEKISAAIFQDLSAQEDVSLNLNAEDSLFVRFNGNKVRQNTAVEQANLSLQLQSQGSTSVISFSLTGQLEKDIQRGHQFLRQAREECAQLPEDPYQVALANQGTSDTHFESQLLAPTEVIEAITGPATGSDLAGLYSAGPLITANKNSKGQSHWFSTANFFMDYSLYDGSKAVKSVYAGNTWNQDEFTANLKETQQQLALMRRPKKTLAPGEYRTYLAPGAMSEILSHFGWGCLGYGDYKRGNSAFRKLAEGTRSFAAEFNLRENFHLGLSPRFNSMGELAPEKLDLIKNGKLATYLISTRSAKEFGATANYASEGESPRSPELMTGKLAKENILKELGTGLYVSNLHYINWSDRQNARITGMTRYACFWVENGEIIAPISDLRFDESLYDCFGPNLMALTNFQEVDPATSTYEARALGGKKNPGALINNFKFTL